ncbi:hypothetical protein PENTCL1PPCAC_13306 [Pristionchus entomophagus]|uniref:Uncharacterized protein n=1 Tax=Pristionchus entomophagus TaxID=358040 RepID=A0AAV5TFQ2_9BILA|nr:hypothetical protein PENTCL1PPCAC_13306 [Pristionchus entomophagus]
MTVKVHLDSESCSVHLSSSSLYVVTVVVITAACSRVTILHGKASDARARVFVATYRCMETLTVLDAGDREAKAVVPGVVAVDLHEIPNSVQFNAIPAR